MGYNHKTACLLITFFIFFTLFPAQVGAINPQPEPPGTSTIEVLIDGLELEMDTQPIIENNRTLVPLRAIFEALGAEVEWNPEARSIVAIKGEMSVKVWIGSLTAYKNGDVVTLDVAPKISNDRTLVPLRFVSEALGAEVGWDGIKRQVSISTSGDESSLPFDTSLISKLKMNIPENEFDSRLIAQYALEAKPFDPGLIQNIHSPFVLDYSDYVTLTGNQDGWGGCIGRAIIHCTNIIREMEQPYTPDLSLWHVLYRQYELAGSGEPDTKLVLENYGMCSEASLPTDYDDATLIKDSNGKVTGVDFNTMSAPTSLDNLEALQLYRLKTYSDPYKDLSVDEVKDMLYQYGPLVAAGPLHIIQGPNPAEGHCISIVGYDDVQKLFKCLNSWGDYWNGNGYFYLPYDDFSYNIEWVRYIEIMPTDRSLTQYAYTARIHVDMNGISRNKLTVKVGVEGEQPLVVWDTPNEQNCVDNSRTLCIDVPLPSYAAQNWPPADNAQWYVEITNHASGSYHDAVVKEITLARLYKNSDGSYASETFQPKTIGTRVEDGETVKINIPAKYYGYTVSLDNDDTTVLKGNSITLEGSLNITTQYDTSDNGTDYVPVPGMELTIYRSRDGINEIVGTTTTGQDGSYSYTFTPDKSGQYRVTWKGKNGIVITSSDYVTIEVNSLQIIPPIHFDLI